MKTVFTLFCIMISLSLSSIEVFAQSKSDALLKSFNVESHKIQLEDGEAAISLKTRFALDTIMGEPKVVCSGTWSFDYAIIDGNRYDSDNLPAEVMNGLKLYNVDILYGAGSGFRAPAVECDLGVFYKSDSNKLSYTMPASPSWNKLFRSISSTADYTSARNAKFHMYSLKKEGKSRTGSRLGGWNEVLNASLNVSSIRQYIEKEKRETKKARNSKKDNKKSDDLEDLLGEIEETNLNSDGDFDEMFGDRTKAYSGEADLASVLDQMDRIETTKRTQKQRDKRLVPLKKQKARMLRSCDSASPKKPADKFYCGRKIVRYTSDDSCTGLCLQIPVYESKISYETRCAKKKAAWVNQKGGYKRRLQTWQSNRQQCISNAHKRYKQGVSRLNKEERNIDNMFE